MSTPKKGDVIQNYQGRYAKVVKVKGNHYGLSAFVGKKEDAEKETVAVKFLNRFGLSQVLGKSKVGNGTTKESATPKNSTVTTTAKASGDGAGNKDNEFKAVADLKVAELQQVATAYGLDTSGKRPDLVARIEAHLQAEVDGMVEHTVTEEDLKTYPVLAEMGVQVGATIYLPAEEENQQ